MKRYHIGVYEGVSSTVATNNELSSVGSSNGQSVLQLYRWLIPMSARLPVLQDGWRVAGVSLCVGEKEDDALLVDQAVLEGKLTFKNPCECLVYLRCILCFFHVLSPKLLSSSL